MLLNVMDSYSVKIVTMYCAFTCTYIPFLMLFLIYADDLYKIGRYKVIYLPIGIVIAEFLKVNFSLMFHDVSFVSKDNKSVKRCYSKVKMKEIFKCVLVVAISIAVYYIIAVLFGALLLTKYEETLMLSILVASLTVIPSCLNVGADQTTSFLIGKPSNSNLVNDMILQYIQFTFLGTWLGAIVIPLDWDRPWQEWPVSCCLGAIAGHVLSHVVTLIKLLPNIIKVFTGKSFQFSRFLHSKNKCNL